MISIEVSSLKKYYGDIKAVDDVSFKVNEGEVFGLFGPNGAGKTTTIEIMEVLRERDGGDVKVLANGEKTRDLNPLENLRETSSPK